LLQHTQVIVALPLLDYLAVLKAVYGDALELHLPPSGRAKVLCLSLVGAAYSVAGDGLISLGYHIFNGDVDVGEGRKECGDELLGLFVASDVLIRFVPDEVGRVDLFYEVRIPLVDDLPRTPRLFLVLFRDSSLLSPLLLPVPKPYPLAGEAKTKCLEGPAPQAKLGPPLSQKRGPGAHRTESPRPVNGGADSNCP
jgi:hypothetical protein